MSANTSHVDYLVLQTVQQNQQNLKDYKADMDLAKDGHHNTADCGEQSVAHLIFAVTIQHSVLPAAAGGASPLGLS